MAKSRYTYDVCPGMWNTFFQDKKTGERLNPGKIHNIDDYETLVIEVPKEYEERPNTMIVVMRLR